MAGGGEDVVVGAGVGDGGGGVAVGRAVSVGSEVEVSVAVGGGVAVGTAAVSVTAAKNSSRRAMPTVQAVSDRQRSSRRCGICRCGTCVAACPTLLSLCGMVQHSSG
jgi:hypothetical protein